MKLYVARIVLEAAVTVFCAEVIAGAVHWFEDAYIREETPVVGRLLGRPNVIHHHYPRHMTHNNWWQSSYDTFFVGVGIVMTCWVAGVLTWEMWLFAALSANANEMHKWTHRTRKENGRIISWLQDMRILQTQRHHSVHHKDPKDVRYCVMTNFVNPVLDTLRFWAGLEWLLEHTIGLKRKPDTSLRNGGPEPEWLREVMPHKVATPVRRLAAGERDDAYASAMAAMEMQSPGHGSRVFQLSRGPVTRPRG